MRMMWDFFQNQLLGMKWLHDLVGKGLTAIGVDTASRIGGSLWFFIYDSIKILVLLAVLIYGIGYVQSYFPPERTKKILGRFKGIGGNTMAALLGTVTPFCSCSSIPLFIGFSSAGLPVGLTFSFLISSPLVDMASMVLIMSIFGAKVAVAYVVMGLVLAVAGGTLIEKLGMERYLEDYIKLAAATDVETSNLSRRERHDFAFEQASSIVKKVYPYVLIGVGIGAVIHNWIPAEWILSILGDNNPFAVVLAALVGVPMYSDIFGVIPIAEALHLKGVGIGTILAFIMAVTALSAPSMIMLRRAVKMKLLVVFVGIVTVGIILNGYLFNAFGSFLK